MSSARVKIDGIEIRNSVDIRNPKLQYLEVEFYTDERLGEVTDVEQLKSKGYTVYLAPESVLSSGKDDLERSIIRVPIESIEITSATDQEIYE